MKTFFLITDHTRRSQRTTALNLARWMSQRDESVTIFCNCDEDVRQEFSGVGLTVVKTSLGGVFDIFSPIKMSRRIEPGDRVAVVVFDLKTLLPAIRLKSLGQTLQAVVKILFMDAGFEYPPLTPEQLRRFMLDVDLAVFPFNSAAERFKGICPTIFQKVAVLHPGLPSPTLPQPTVNPPETIEEGGDKGFEPLEIITLGEIVPQRGIHNLIVLLELLATRSVTSMTTPLPYHMTIIGTGQGRDVMPIIRYAKSAGVNCYIDWAGDARKPYSSLSKSDVGIVPSVAPCDDYISVLQILSLGLPVIATSKGYASELKEILPGLSDRITILSDSSPEALAEAVRNHVQSTSEGVVNKPVTDLGECSFERFYERFKGVLNSMFSRP